MLKRTLNFRTLLACFLVIAASEAALATTAVVPRDDELVVECRAIVTGKVTGLSTAVDQRTDLVYTYIRLDVNSVLKGQIGEREIVLKEVGGETGDYGTRIFGAPTFELGQEVLLYLNTWPDGALRVHQGFLGKFDINREPSTGRAIVERRMDDQNIAIMTGSGNGTNRSALEAYTQTIGQLIQTNRKKMLKFEQRFFSNAPMLGHPIEYELSHSGAEITPQWVVLNPANPSRWFEADSGQAIAFYVNPAGAPSFASLQEDMQAAMDAWSKAGGSIQVTYGGATSGCGVQIADGLNTISFNNCDNYFVPSQGCAGLLAVSGIVRYMPSQTKVVGGMTFSKAIEANMSFNPYGLCNFTNRCELQEVAAHEMGHALGLGHTSDANATMAPFAHFDNRCASIMADDVQGINAIYPGGAGGGQLRILTAELPAASVGVDYSMNLEARGGAGGYHWSLVSGQTPVGMQLGMSGLLFGKPGPEGSFGFTAQVLDSSGNASQSSFTLVVNPPGLAPAIASAEYRKKKVFVTGRNFVADAVVYVDGEALSATLDGTTLMTQKRKQKAGVHQVYVVNPDGKQSNIFELVIE